MGYFAAPKPVLYLIKHQIFKLRFVTKHSPPRFLLSYFKPKAQPYPQQELRRGTGGEGKMSVRLSVSCVFLMKFWV